MNLRKLLPFSFMLILVLASCKKEKDEPNIIITPPAELRQASIEATVSGSFTDAFTIYEGSEYPDEGISAQYGFNFLTIQANRNYGSSLIFQFIAGVPTLEIGINALTVGQGESVALYNNDGIPTGALELHSGILNITAVDPVPTELTIVNARYVSGTFNLTMVDDNTIFSVEVNGSFTDVLVLMY